MADNTVRYRFKRFTRYLVMLRRRFKRLSRKLPKASSTFSANGPADNVKLQEVDAPHADVSTATILENLQKVGGPRVRKHSNPLQNVTKFMSRISKPKEDVKCSIRSLHGYSSLRMFQAKPRACMNKVRG